MNRFLIWIGVFTLIGFTACNDDEGKAINQVEDTQDKPPKFVKDFNVTNSLIPVEEIQEGGPPKDGIPAIDEPKYLAVNQVEYLLDNDLVLGLVVGNRARAYPTRILDWHEIVNDSIDDESYLITYCPLCGSGMAFSGEWGNERRTFGVSGLLYNSDVLLYDRKTESLWSQIMGKAVTGKEIGTELQQVPIIAITWKFWKEKYPNSEVLSTETGWERDYSLNAYEIYRKNQSKWFPVSAESNDFENKDWVLGIEIEGRFKAYPFVELKKSSENSVIDFFNGQKLTIDFDPDSETGTIRNETGDLLPSTRLYWFAWYAFHPNTEVYLN